MSGYTLYIVRCADRTLYTGITRDIARRLREHNASRRGARYTKSRRPVTLLVTKQFRNRSTATRAEAQVKRLPRSKKLAYFRKFKVSTLG